MVSGVTVTPAEVEGGAAPAPITTPTTSPNIYYFPTIAAGSYTVSASASGYATTAMPVIITSGGNATLNLVLEPTPLTVSGTVYDANTNAPLPGATVEAVTSAGVQIGTNTATTAANGTFTLTVAGGTAPGNVYIQGSAAGYASSNPFVSLPAPSGNDTYTGVNVPLYPATGFTVNVDNALTNAGIGGVAVTAVLNGGTAVFGPVTTTNGGVAAFPAVEAGTYTITLNPATYMPFYSSIASPTGTITETTAIGTTPTLTVTLNPTPSLFVNVNDSVSGLGIAGVTVTATPNNGGNPLTGTTNANGVASFPNVASATYTITLTLPNGYVSIYSPSQPITGTVTAPNSTTVGILLQPAQELFATVVDSQTGAGISGASLTITNGTNSYGPVTTNASGKYGFSNIAAGTYTATASAANYTQATPLTSFVVSATGATSASIPLNPVNTSINGVVTSSVTGLPISGATVNAVNSTGTVNLTVTTFASGAYSIGNAEAGTYSITVSATGFTSQTATAVTVVTGTPTSQSFALVPTSVHQFSPGLQMFSAPYDYTGMSLASILTGDYDSTTNPGTPNVIATWLPQDNAYVKSPTAPCDTLHAGQGYWGRFGSSGGTLIVQGTVVPAGRKILLSPGWNMIADPYTTADSLSSLTFDDSAGRGDPTTNNAPYTFAAASETGGVSLISPYLYTYAIGASSYTSIYVGGPDGQSLNPYQGYWILANTTCTLYY